MDADTLPRQSPIHGFQQRRGRFHAYVCCCPLTLPLAPLVVSARLARHGVLRLFDRPVTWPWAQ